MLFTDAVSTGGCGNAPSSVGPFYCPPDAKAYIDLSFFKQLQSQYGAPGDFARVYVLAHELGHHVQNLRRHERRGPAGPAGRAGEQANELSVAPRAPGGLLRRHLGTLRAGPGLIEPGDIAEGLDAAAAVGDDALGNGNQESWTHGSSESRQRWFEVGFDSGDLERVRHLLGAGQRPLRTAR